VVPVVASERCPRLSSKSSAITSGGRAMDRGTLKSFAHSGLEKLFRTGSAAGVKPALAPRIRRILAQLDVATRPEDMNTPGSFFHPLQGRLPGFWSVRVSGNWRVIFQFDGIDAIRVDFVDYH
jgi:proteic killer suppression protein